LSTTKSRKKLKTTKSGSSQRRGVLVFAAVVVVVLLVGAYIVSQPPREPGSIGDIAPDFSLPVVTSSGLSGQTLTLSSLRGKVVVLEFMVSWCHVCQQMAPSIEYLNARYQGQDVVFVSVAGTQRGATAESTAEFVTQYHVTWTHVLDTDNSVFALYKVDSTPTYLILDRSGKILSKFQGFVATDALSNAIDLALSS
jgi:thiol-disulfide isomerase/thioredoxin